MSTYDQKRKNGSANASIKLDTFKLARWLCDNQSSWVACPLCGYDSSLRFDEEKSRLVCDRYCNYSIHANTFFRKKKSSLFDMCNEMHGGELGRKARISVI